MTIAKKIYGQHFLNDKLIVEKIIENATDINRNNILEVGPGPGALTEAVLNATTQRVMSIEIDNQFDNHHQMLMNKFPNYEFVRGDALTLDITKHLSKPITIIANLPYNISTALITNWLRDIGMFSSILVMVQKEVADRIIAQPCSKKYGRLSVISQIFCKTEKCFDVPKECFDPQPKVTSSVIKMTPLDNYVSLLDFDTLSNFIKIIFSQKRKVLTNTLKPIIDNPTEFLSSLNISPKIRAEELSVDKICALIELYQNNKL